MKRGTKFQVSDLSPVRLKGFETKPFTEYFQHFVFLLICENNSIVTTFPLFPYSSGIFLFHLYNMVLKVTAESVLITHLVNTFWCEILAASPFALLVFFLNL